MASLLQTNVYLRNPRKRRAMLQRNALDSSVIEGARGLKVPNRTLRRQVGTGQHTSIKSSSTG